MDLHHRVKRNRTDSSSDDESEILESPIESENDPIAADSTANSSVGRQSNSPMTQVEADGLLQRISLEIHRLNAGLKEKDKILSETQVKLTQCESDKSQFSLLCCEAILKLERFQRDSKREKEITTEAHSRELERKSVEIDRLRLYNQSFRNELQQKDRRIDQMVRDSHEVERKLVESESLKTQFSQLYKEESAKFTTVQQQLDGEKVKNRQKDQMLAELQNELTEKSTEISIKSAEIHNKSGEIVKLRQNAQSLRTQLELKSNENLTIKSEVKSVLEAELNCSICSKQMTEAVVTVECGHIFCQKCIDRWINQGNQTCPFCRSECHRSAPILAIPQIQAKLLCCVNAEQPIVTRSNGENLPIRNDNNTSAANNFPFDDSFVNEVIVEAVYYE